MMPDKVSLMIGLLKGMFPRLIIGLAIAVVAATLLTARPVEAG